MKRKIIFTISILGLCSSSHGDVMPTEEKTIKRIFPDEPGFKNDTEYKKKFEEMKVQLEDLRKKAENAQNTLKFANENQERSTQQPPPENSHIAQNNDSFSNEQNSKTLFVLPKPKKRQKIPPPFLKSNELTFRLRFLRQVVFRSLMYQSWHVMKQMQP